jgi:parallel beta-helix repeat protein
MSENSSASDGGLAVGRRRLLKSGVAFAVTAATLGIACRKTVASAATQVSTTSAVSSRTRGKAVVNVRDKGARGDGRTDDTSALQAAIDALPATGGTVHVPGGTYMVDAVRSLQLRSRMHLELAADARLVAIANGEKKSFVVLAMKVEDVEVSGGRIIGERVGHSGGEGEWGHGIQIRGSSRVTLRDLHADDCWGDGIYVGSADHDAVSSEDVVIARVVCHGNRRQGLSICGARNVRVLDSEFSGTAGTNPQYGIDIEPNRQGTVSDVRIENCVVRQNKGGGIQVFKRVSAVTIVGCTIEGNGGAGIFVAGARDGVIARNRIRDNGRVGVALRPQTSNFEVRDNQFANNEVRRPANARLAADEGSGSAVRVAKDTDSIRLIGNQYQ